MKSGIDFILQHLVDNLLQSCTGALRPQLIKLAAEFEHSMQLGSKPILHLEAFVAGFMSDYKQFMENVNVNDFMS